MATFRLKGETLSGKVWLNEKELDLRKSLKVKHYSPRGFSWGYNGAATKQLSLAIALAIYDKKLALDTYLDLNRIIVSKLPHQASFDETFTYFP